MGKDYGNYLEALKRVDPNHPFLHDYFDVQSKFDSALQSVF